MNILTWVRNDLNKLDESVGKALRGFCIWARANFKMFLGAMILLSLFIFGGIYLGKFVEATTNKVASAPSHFWSWILGILIIVGLVWLVNKFWKKREVKGYDSNKKVERPQREIRIGSLFWPVVVVVAVVIYLNRDALPSSWNKESSSQVRGNVASNVEVLTAPAEVVLPIIAFCESGGRQFDDEGNLIGNPTTTAVGKYQIMASLHEEKAQSMGLDIRTLEGNEAYAEFLYQESGTKHWETDPRSKNCWEPLLLSHGYTKTDPFVKVMRIGREWSEPVFFKDGQRVDWMPKSAVTYQVMTANGRTTTFPAKPESPIEVPSCCSPWIRFRAIDADSVDINIVTSGTRS